MAIVDGEAISACTTMAEALCVTIPTLVEASTEVVTLIAGEGASDDATQAFEDAIARTFPTVTIEHLQGGQPLYPYLISAE